MRIVENFWKKKRDFRNTDSFGPGRIFDSIFAENECSSKLTFWAENENETDYLVEL